MNSLPLNKNLCRVCLKHGIKLNWNDEILKFCGISYKDCYYKYTQLEEFDSDCYPTNLCQTCANELKNAHMLFEKAMESFNILHAAAKSKQLGTEYFGMDICNMLPVIKAESDAFDQSLSCKEDFEKNSKCESLTKATFANQLEGYYDELPHRPATKSTSSNIEIAKSLLVSSLERNRRDSSEDKSEPHPAKPKNGRDKYLLMCAYCSLKVEGHSRLATHEATHSEHRKRTEICPQCGVKLYNKLSLTEHMKTHDENRQKNHKCEFCGNAFYNRGSLNVHRRIHLGLMVKCQICAKEFFRQIDLDQHLLTHSACPLQRNVGKKKYTVQCQYCDKSVLTVKWKSHIAAHQGEPQVKCKICDKNFFSRTNCTNHLRRFHLKKSREYENFIHYYGDGKARVSCLMMKQQLSARPLISNTFSNEL